MDVIRAVVPAKDGCPILTRLAAFVIDQNTHCILEHVIRLRDGTPRKLLIPCSENDIPVVPGSSSVSAVSESSASSSGPCEDIQFLVSAKWSEWVVGCPMGATVTDVPVQVHRPDEGIVRLQVNPLLAGRPGLFRIEWGIFDRLNRLIAVDHSLVSVEFNSFGERLPEVRPPTIKELQMWIMDSAPNENFLLDDVEFTPEQILLALAWPIERWNELPPHTRTYSSADFPFRHIWMLGTVSKLYEMAAHHYRRNFLPTSGGGVSVPDKGKERDYLAESMRLRQEFEAMLHAKKLQQNVSRCFGVFVSPYFRM